MGRRGAPVALLLLLCIRWTGICWSVKNSDEKGSANDDAFTGSSSVNIDPVFGLTAEAAAGVTGVVNSASKLDPGSGLGSMEPSLLLLLLTLLKMKCGVFRRLPTGWLL